MAKKQNKTYLDHCHTKLSTKSGTLSSLDNYFFSF